jgi:hypothetical protein
MRRSRSIGELADYRDTVLQGLLALRRDEAWARAMALVVADRLRRKLAPPVKLH